MKQIALSEIKDDLSKYLRLAEKEEIIITKHGKPAGLLVGFASDDDWFDYRLEHDARFLERIARARKSPRRQGSQARGSAARAKIEFAPNPAINFTAPARPSSALNRIHVIPWTR